MPVQRLQKVKEPWAMYKTTLPIIAIILAGASAAWGQSPPPAPAPATQLNLQILAESLRTAATFHDLVKSLNIEKNLNLDTASPASAEPLSRMAAVLGAGAGAGAAIGEMKGGQKAVLIGAVAGAAGALVIDKVLQHQASKSDPRAAGTQPVPEPKDFKTRPGNPVQ
jgi:hypothetical protein